MPSLTIYKTSTETEFKLFSFFRSQQQWIDHLDKKPQLPLQRLDYTNNDYKMSVPPHFICLMAFENLPSPGPRSN